MTVSGSVPGTGFATHAWLIGLPIAAGAVLLLLAVTFVVSKIAHKHSVIDTAWGLLFAVIAIVSFIASSGHGDSTRRWLLLVLPVLWGVRLGGHIASRTIGKPEDPRYEALLRKAKGNPDLYAIRMVYLLQGLLAFLISIPIQVGAYEGGPVGWLAWLGVAPLGDRHPVRGDRRPADGGLPR